jgi:hypothetical protein
MKQAGGKGKVGIWVLAFRNPVNAKDGNFDLDAGVMLSVSRGISWLLSGGIKGIGTVGIGWVHKETRYLEAAHQAAHAEGVEHTH